MIKKLLLSLFTDEKTRKRILLMIGSILVVLGCMMMFPFMILAQLNQTEPPEIQFDESEFLLSIDTEKLTEMESECETIADILIDKGLQNQILKAQLIYISCSDGNIENLNEYADIFHISDDKFLINTINSYYGFEISQEEFQRTYLFVKNATIDPYLFENSETKNSTDLTAWCRNAYESGWLSESGCGEINPEKQWRTADNIDLILGYFNYLPTERTFGESIDTLFYTEQGTPDTMPQIAGIGLFTGSEFGVYDGNGEVFFSSADGQTVQKISVFDERWVSWVTYDGLEYPQELWDWIDELNAPEEESEQNEEGV